MTYSRRQKSLGLSRMQMREVARSLQPNITDSEFNKMWFQMAKAKRDKHV